MSISVTLIYRNFWYTYIIQLLPLGLFSGRLHQVPKRLHISHTFKLSIFTVFPIIFVTINPYTPCQLSLREETGAPGENPRLSAECWRTLSTCDQMFDTGLETVTSVVPGRRLDDWATEDISGCSNVIGIFRYGYDIDTRGRGWWVSIELPECAIIIKLPQFSILNFLFIKLPETSFLHRRHLTCWCFSDAIALVQIIERWCFAKNGGKRENFAKQTTKKSSAFVKDHRFS